MKKATLRTLVVLLSLMLLCQSVPAQNTVVEKPAVLGKKRILAGHYLRRLGFGSSPKDLNEYLANPERYIETQLNPETIDDSAVETRLPRLDNNSPDRFAIIASRWYLRMAYSKRQLQEKMTLFWHEYFSVSANKVIDAFIPFHEDLLRKNSLGNFRQMLIEVTKDNAMLLWLDNGGNNGRAIDASGNRIPPNQNYARELMQLYAIGTTRLNMDGTPILDENGISVANYTEDDVREVARALTGWDVGKPTAKSVFNPDKHDQGDKMILGNRVAGRVGLDGAREVEDVIDILMNHPSMPPFIVKQLIQKFVTEDPSPAYIERVATVFKQTRGDIRATMRALINDPEFTASENVRTQFKEPIEYFVNFIRAMEAETKGRDIVFFTFKTKQLVHFPPSVFSFYRPGQKKSLVDSSTVLFRDTYISFLTSGFSEDTRIDFAKIVRENNLNTPEKVIEHFAGRLLSAPLSAETRDIILSYMKGTVTEEKVRGAVWLITCSVDYQRN